MCAGGEPEKVGGGGGGGSIGDAKQMVNMKLRGVFQ